MTTTTEPTVELEDFLVRPEYTAEDLATLCNMPETAILDAARKGAFVDCVGTPGHYGFRIRRGAAITWLRQSGLVETLVGDPWRASMARRRRKLVEAAERCVAELMAEAERLGIEMNWGRGSDLSNLRAFPAWVSSKVKAFRPE